MQHVLVWELPHNGIAVDHQGSVVFLIRREHETPAALTGVDVVELNAG